MRSLKHIKLDNIRWINFGLKEEYSVKQQKLGNKNESFGPEQGNARENKSTCRLVGLGQKL